MSDSSWPWRQLHTWRWQRGWCVHTAFYFGFSASADSCLSRESSVMASRSKHWWNVLLKPQRGFDVHTFTMQRQNMLLQCVIALSSRTNFLKMEKRSRANPSSLCRLCVFQCISATSAQSTELELEFLGSNWCRKYQVFMSVHPNQTMGAWTTCFMSSPHFYSIVICLVLKAEYKSVDLKESPINHFSLS